MVFYWSIQAYIVKIQFLFFPIVGRKTKIREVWYLSNLTPPTPPHPKYWGSNLNTFFLFPLSVIFIKIIVKIFFTIFFYCCVPYPYI